MEDIHIEALRRKAVAGDDTAICPLLLALGADPAMVKRVATKLHSRDRDRAAQSR